MKHCRFTSPESEGAAFNTRDYSLEMRRRDGASRKAGHFGDFFFLKLLCVSECELAASSDGQSTSFCIKMQVCKIQCNFLHIIC